MRKRAQVVGALGLALQIALPGCLAPGHQLAYRQMDEPHTVEVLAVQGYVVQGDGAELRYGWQRVVGLMSQKPGFLRAELSPGIGEQSNLWIALAYWRSMRDLRAAFSDPAVREAEAELPAQQFVHLFSPDCRYTPSEISCP